VRVDSRVFGRRVPILGDLENSSGESARRSIRMMSTNSLAAVVMQKGIQSRRGPGALGSCGEKFVS
jgi:hypothetical protein